jgi:hypothetical protein
MRARILAVFACAGFIAASCRTVPAHYAPNLPLESPGRDEITPDGAVPWAAMRRLSWSDYRAQPLIGGGQAAVTAYSLRWGFRCSGAAFNFQVVTVFFPDRSWVSSALLSEPARGRLMLQHEQTHFDLSEVYARRMRRFFSTLDRPCDRTTEDLSALGDNFVRDESDAQRRYDEETANGRDARVQLRWEDEVKKLLETLAEWRETPGIAGTHKYGNMAA